MDKTEKHNIAVFASGGGSNLQAIIDACKSGQINAQVCVVISNNKNAYALERARSENIPAYHIVPGQDEDILDILKKYGSHFIFLTGYLKKISPSVLTTYQVYNIHPSLLPKHGGKGMYGLNVHRAVLMAGDKMTGITIHRVDTDYDTGPIIAQQTVPVFPEDTPEELAARVLEKEHTFIVETITKLLQNVN